jgi:hypothetical protein
MSVIVSWCSCIVLTTVSTVALPLEVCATNLPHASPSLKGGPAGRYGVGVSSWRRCEKCRKVKAVDEYDDASPICRACLTAPPPRKKAAAVKTTRTVPTAEPVTPRRNLTGAVGSGDLEARERRAKRTAWEQLAELHPEEFEQLLQIARKAEGLRT